MTQDFDQSTNKEANTHERDNEMQMQIQMININRETDSIFGSNKQIGNNHQKIEFDMLDKQTPFNMYLDKSKIEMWVFYDSFRFLSDFNY